MATNSTAIASNSMFKGVISWPARVRDYIDALRTEMKHVTWPSKSQVRATTGVVIVTVFLFAAYFALVDLVLGRAVNHLFQILAHKS
jgi:preprotein translocase subunit SecE